MGLNCSVFPDDDNPEKHETAQIPQPPRPATRVLHHLRSPIPIMADVRRRKSPKEGDQYDLVEPLNAVAGKRLRRDANATTLPRVRGRVKSPGLLPNGAYDDVESYNAMRDHVTRFENALSFDYDLTVSASPDERRANVILQRVREHDIRNIYETAPPRRGYGGQMHPRFFGDHFLGNFDLIQQSKLYHIIHKMPKGAHLHIHFNANLLPNVLIDIAKTMTHMYITSDLPLVEGVDPDPYDRCKIQFSILSDQTLQEQGGQKDIFSKDYTARQPMPFSEFLARFQMEYRLAHGFISNGNSTADKVTTRRDIDVDTWLRNKLVFDEEEAHNLLQTADG